MVISEFESIATASFRAMKREKREEESQWVSERESESERHEPLYFTSIKTVSIARQSRQLQTISTKYKIGKVHAWQSCSFPLANLLSFRVSSLHISQLVSWRFQAGKHIQHSADRDLIARRSPRFLCCIWRGSPRYDKCYHPESLRYSPGTNLLSRIWVLVCVKKWRYS